MSDLLRRQYDEMVAENATLQSQLAARDAEVARLREAGSVLAEYVEHQPYSLARMTAIEAWRAALAAPTSGEADADH